MLMADQIKTIVPMWRDDVGNDGLQTSLKRMFPASGGAVLDGVKYGTRVPDFSAEVTALSAQVQQAVQQQGAGSVGVYLAAFEGDVPGIFGLAQRDPLLSSVRWYGSDGVALSAVLTANEQAARYAAAVGYPNPQVGLDERIRDRWQPLIERADARSGLALDSFALTSYDAAWVAALAWREAGGNDPAALASTLTRIANAHEGVTGPTTLNEAGDRALGNYDFWAIRGDTGQWEWKRVARYQAGAGGPGTLVPEGP